MIQTVCWTTEISRHIAILRRLRCSHPMVVSQNAGLGVTPFAKIGLGNGTGLCGHRDRHVSYRDVDVQTC